MTRKQLNQRIPVYGGVVVPWYESYKLLIIVGVMIIFMTIMFNGSDMGHTQNGSVVDVHNMTDFKLIKVWHYSDFRGSMNIDHDLFFLWQNMTVEESGLDFDIRACLEFDICTPIQGNSTYERKNV